MRIGHGYDVHQLVNGRPLILGGVNIPHHQGLLGHSDADVLLHAVCDAIIGALGLGDIGQHFPDTDSQYAGADSRDLLRHVITIMHDRHFKLGNLDVTVAAQKPKLSPYLDVMKTNLALDCDCQMSQLNIKATTTEKLGFVGREEGIEAHAVVILMPVENHD